MITYPRSPTFPVFLIWFIIPKFQYENSKEAYAIKSKKSYCRCKNHWGDFGFFGLGWALFRLF